MMQVTPTVQSVCWLVFDTKWAAVNDLEFNFATRHTSGHTEPRYAKLWRHNDIIFARYYHVRFCQQM